MALDEPGRIGNVEAVYNTEGLLLVVKYALPDVMAFLINNRGVEQAAKDLQEIGATVAQRMLLVWEPENTDPIKLLKEIKKKFFRKSKQIKGKVLKKFGGAPSKIRIRDRDCPVCPEQKGEEVEISAIHYCTSISGFIEGVLKYLIKEKRTPYTDARCETVASVGSGHKVCEMVIDLKYGG